MSVMVKDSLGRWVQAAGQGKAEYGASTVRTGTVTLTASSTIGGAAVKNVTFNSPMPDATYEVTLTLGGEGNDSTATVVYNTKTANGFTIRLTTLHSAASGKSVTIGYTAFKLYTDTEYNQVLAALPPVDAVTDGNMKAVTSNAVYDALSNVVVTTADVVEDGNMNPVTSNAVYDALGNVVVTPVDAVTNGDMRAVTSNAVYDFCDEKWLDISSYFTTVYSKSAELLNPSMTVKLSNRGFIKIRFYFDLNVSNTSRSWLACALETPNTQEARDELRGKIRDFSEYIYTILYVNKRGISESYMEIVTEPGPATLSNSEVRLSPNRTTSPETITLLAYVLGDFCLAISPGTHMGGWSNERTFKI